MESIFLKLLTHLIHPSKETPEPDNVKTYKNIDAVLKRILQMDQRKQFNDF